MSSITCARIQPDAVYIALGANLGDPKESFNKAFKALEASGVDIPKVSGLWQSPSWPAGKGHPDYINACAEVSYSGTAAELLARLHEVEAKFGRERSVLNAPRTLDLDLLDFRGERVETASISLPHPRMMVRGFVLFPLAQIAPDWRHPITNEHIDVAIAKLPLSDVAPMTYLGALDRE